MNATSDPDLSPLPDALPGFASEGETFQHYQVLRREDGSLWELGRGAMGVTYKAFDTNLRCHVALKVISAHYLDSEMAGQRFIREARIAARVRHPNIATVYHLGVDPQGFFYAMEFIEGETLEQLVTRVGPLPLETVLRIGLQVARALAAASRQGLIHRDIKPANLMVIHQDEDGADRLLVKMIDFGLARSYAGDDSHPQLTATGFVGTPLFASPEQLEERDLDVRSDIYSLGVTLWILLTGQPPFAGKLTQVITQHLHAPPPWWQLGECGDSVRALLERMLHKNRLQRHQSATELRVAIEECLRCLTGKDDLSGEWSEPADPERVSAARGPVKTDTELTVTTASSPGAAAQPRAAGFPVGRRLVHLRSPLAGVVAVALCVCGLVYWHSLTGTADAARLSTQVVAGPATAPVQTAVVPVAEPSPSQPNSPRVALETPPSDTARALFPRQDEPAAKPTDDPPSPPGVLLASDDLSGLDGSPTTMLESPASPSPTASPAAVNDDHADAQDDHPGTPVKSQPGAGRTVHSHHGNRPAPTPTPSFFQKLFGIKPKPKSK